MSNFYSQNIRECIELVNSSPRGLTSEQARSRLFSNNDIKSAKKNTFLNKFIGQFKDLMILILLIAAAVSIFIGIWQKEFGEVLDGIIILAIVFMNAVFGVMQEAKAEKSLEALKKMAQPKAMILRDDQVKQVALEDIVLGDILVLEAGCILPADVRIIESVNLQIDESSLTGESVPSHKDASAVLSAKCPLAERINMAYRGCVVAGGRGLGLVVAVGEKTELGKIAQSISTSEKSLTPLQKNIKEVGKFLTYLVLGIAAITFVLEVVARPGNPLEAFLTAVAISVAAIPESMPAVITIIMSMGVSRLARQKAIVKHLHSVETLGACEVICSDKTGTITQNKMTVVSCFCDGKLQTGKFIKNETLLSAMLLCNNCTRAENGFSGDGTEIALCEFGQRQGVEKNSIENVFTRIGELPFDSQRKLMSTHNIYKGEKTVFCKGAVDNLLEKCNKILINGKVVDLSSQHKKAIERANSEMADRALRVLAFAFKPSQVLEERDLIFIGLVGMMDPPRKEIVDAVKKCKRAGMRAVMITGDHKETAFAVAKECGIAQDMSQVLTGSELDCLSDQQLQERLKDLCVFARVSPQDKVRIVEAFKNQGKVVAMTGDGVNDAPSLKHASIGIGMGQSGTDVTKEVADMLVADDNFATIVVAVEEGRKIYQNIVKAVKFLFSANMGELMSLFLATVFFPNYVFLFPVQILFVNLITDSLPAIALGLEAPEGDIMSVPPRDIKRGLFANGCGLSIIVLGLIQTLLTIFAYYIGIVAGGQAIGVTMAFYTLNIIQMFYLASMRTNGSMFKSNPFKNKMFLIAIAFSFGLLGTIALTPLHSILKLENLSLSLWGIIFGLSLIMMFASEMFKFCYKIYSKYKKKPQ